MAALSLSRPFCVTYIMPPKLSGPALAAKRAAEVARVMACKKRKAEEDPDYKQKVSKYEVERVKTVAAKKKAAKAGKPKLTNAEKQKRLREKRKQTDPVAARKQKSGFADFLHSPKNGSGANPTGGGSGHPQVRRRQQAAAARPTS